MGTPVSKIFQTLQHAANWNFNTQCANADELIKVAGLHKQGKIRIVSLLPNHFQEVLNKAFNPTLAKSYMQSSSKHAWLEKHCNRTGAEADYTTLYLMFRQIARNVNKANQTQGN